MLVSSERHHPSPSFNHDSGCFRLGLERPEERGMPVNTHFGVPTALPSLVERDSAMVRDATSVVRLVLHVGGPGSLPKVLAPVIEAVSVEMVAFSGVAFFKSQNVAVHADGVQHTGYSTGTNHVSATRAPLMLTESFGVKGADQTAPDEGVSRFADSNPGNVAAEVFDGDAWRISAYKRTEAPEAFRDLRGDKVLDLVTRLTGHHSARSGTITGHRLTPSVGVTTPADHNIGAGFRRINFTSYFESMAGIPMAAGAV